MFSITMLPALVFAEPWNVLRPLVDATQAFGSIITAVAFIASLCLIMVAGLAVKKHNSRKMWLVFTAFGLFFIKLLMSVLDIYFSPGDFMNGAIRSTFDLFILVSLFLAIFQK